MHLESGGTMMPASQKPQTHLTAEVNWPTLTQPRIFPMTNVPLHLQQGTGQVFEYIYGSINPCWWNFFDGYTAGCTLDQTLKSMKHGYTVTFDFKNIVNTYS